MFETICVPTHIRDNFQITFKWDPPFQIGCRDTKGWLACHEGKLFVHNYVFGELGNESEILTRTSPC